MKIILNTEKRSCTDVICLVIFLVFCVSFVGVAFYAFYAGNPGQLVHPSNSAGEICGQGNQGANPNLLYFDLTQCAGLQAKLASCPTPQVCVEECPRTYWSSAQGKSSGLNQFCDNLIPGQLEDSTTPISKLVEERSCPAYLLPSTPVLGRCVPTFGLVRREEAGRAEDKMKYIKLENGEVLEQEKVLKGIDYVMAIINARGHGEKILSNLQVFWWIVLLSFLLALVLSLIWKILINLATKPVIWASIVLSLAILLAGTVSSFIRFSLLRTEREEIFLPSVMTTMTSYWFNKNKWGVCGIILSVITIFTLIHLGLLRKQISLSVKLFEEASKAVNSLKSVLLIPCSQSIVQVSLISLALTVASFMTSSGVSVYRVVNSCSSETCINTATKKMFTLNDVCDPGVFAECTGCPRAQCVHHKFESSGLADWLQGFILIATVWLLSFVQSFGDMVMAKVISDWYIKADIVEEALSTAKMLPSFKRTCRYHLGTIACRAVIPTMRCFKKGYKCVDGNGYVSTAVHGDSFWEARIRGSSLYTKNTDEILGFVKLATFLCFTSKLCLVGIVAVASLAIFYTQAGSSMETHLNYNIVTILMSILGSYYIISAFLAMYLVAVETIVFSVVEDMKRNDGNEATSTTCCLLTLKMIKMLKLDEHTGEIETISINVM